MVFFEIVVFEVWKRGCVVYATIFNLGPPLHAHGLGAAADWTWRGKLDLVCVMDLVCM